MKTTLTTLALSVAILALPTAARAWGNRSAHPAINHEAYVLFQEQLPVPVPGEGGVTLDTASTYTGEGVIAPGKVSIRTGPLTLTVDDWLVHGGFSADEPEATAAWRHFYDPFLASGGVSYLTDHVPDGFGINPQIDAKTWALDHAENRYSLAAARQLYREAFEGTADDPAVAYAGAFRALGETMHLVADMVQPAHVRNDAHAYAEPLEDNVDGALVALAARDEVSPGVSFQGLSTPALFDELATFTNQSFYTADTISNTASPEVLPANGQTPNAQPQLSAFSWDAPNYQYTGSFGSRTVPMIKETLSSYVARKVSRRLGTPEETPVYTIPSYFAADQAHVLIPLAVQGNAALLHRFFPALRLEVLTTSVDEQTVAVWGRLEHDIGDGTEWPTPLAYSGQGSVWKRTAGGGEERLLGVVFEDGVITTPLNVTLSDEETTVFLRVETGGLVLESPDETLSAAGAATYWLLCYGDSATPPVTTVYKCLEYVGDIEDLTNPTLTKAHEWCYAQGYGAYGTSGGFSQYYPTFVGGDGEAECRDMCAYFAGGSGLCETPPGGP